MMENYALLSHVHTFFTFSNVGVSYVIIVSESPDTTILACQKQPHSAVCDALAEPRIQQISHCEPDRFTLHYSKLTWQ